MNAVKMIIVLIFLICMSITSYASDAMDEQYVVRKVKWGMTQEEVKTSEDGQQHKSYGDYNYSFIEYSINILEEPAKIKYCFSKNELNRIMYVISPSNLRRAEEIFKKITYVLESKYKEEKIVNTNPAIADIISDMSKSHRDYESVNTKISIAIYGQKTATPFIHIMYVTPEEEKRGFDELERKIEQQINKQKQEIKQF